MVVGKDLVDLDTEFRYIPRARTAVGASVITTLCLS